MKGMELGSSVLNSVVSSDKVMITFGEPKAESVVANTKGDEWRGTYILKWVISFDANAKMLLPFELGSSCLQQIIALALLSHHPNVFC